MNKIIKAIKEGSFVDGAIQGEGQVTFYQDDGKTIRMTKIWNNVFISLFLYLL